MRGFTPHSSLLTPLCAAALGAALSGCGSAPRQPESPSTEPRSERPPPPRVAKAPSTVQTYPSRPSRGGGYYLDDGPGDSPPPDLESIPEPVPQLEPLHRAAMRPYVVLGQNFTPMTELQPYRVRGVASWYGRRYHGKTTSNGEIYDMYAISAAHPTLPIPSYARVTNLANGKSIIVRVNDRGPFLNNRIIDLSYTAAHRLGTLAGGSGMVEVESIIPDGSGTMVAAAPRPRVAVAPAPPRSAPQTEVDPILAIAAAARDVDPALPAETPRETPPDPAGVYLQLAAFGSRENAESYLSRAKVQFDWLADRLQVRSREGLFRVHAGPYASPVDAKLAAERIAGSLGAKPLISR